MTYSDINPLPDQYLTHAHNLITQAEETIVAVTSLFLFLFSFFFVKALLGLISPGHDTPDLHSRVLALAIDLRM